METAIKLDEGNSKEYEVEAIRDSVVYAKESDSGYHLLGLYYLVSWKGYPEEENTWEPASAVLHLRKLINTFHRDHPEKPTVTSPPIDSAPTMARPTVRPRPQSPNKNEANRPRPMALASALKTAELPVFYLVFGPVSIAGKRSPQSRDFLLCSVPQFEILILPTS